MAAFHNLELGERKLEGHHSLVEELRILVVGLHIQEVHQLESTGIDKDYHPLEKRELSC